MKKKLILFSSFLIIIFALISIVKVKNKITFFGDYILNPMDDSYKKKNYNYSFSNNNLTSTLLLEYLDYNALDVKSNLKINKLIKQSKKIYISVGMNDLLNYVSLIENTLSYNPTIIYEKIALLEYNIFEIINSIFAIKNIEIYYVSLYYLNDESLDEIIKEFNEEIKELLVGIGANYLEVNEVLSVSNYQFTINEQKEIYNFINKWLQVIK